MSLCTSIRPQKSFSDFDLIWCVGRPRLDIRTNMTLTRSKVKIKVTELLKFQKLHFSSSISCAILTWSSYLMVNYDNWDLIYSLSEPDFLISFSESYHVTSDFVECWHYRTFKGPYFSIAWGSSHVVGYAGSPVCIVRADMTLTRSKVKVTWVWPSAPFWGLLFSSSHDLTQEAH